MRTSSAELDFAAVFAALAGATAVFAADASLYRVLAASDALLAAAHRRREANIGRPLEAAFSNRADPRASGWKTCASIAAAVRTGTPQHMDRQRHDLQRPDGVLGALLGRRHHSCPRSARRRPLPFARLLPVEHTSTRR